MDDVDAFLHDKGVVLSAAQGLYCYLTPGHVPPRSTNPSSSSVFGRRTAMIELHGRKRSAAPIPSPRSLRRRRVVVNAEIAGNNGELVVID
jgi:hypothetical protein